MDKEQVWLGKRLGRITASELNEVMSASGKYIDGNVDYIRHKRWERRHGYRLPINGRALDIGKEQEKYAVAWLRNMMPEVKIVYSQELDEIPVWEADWGNFAASPDAFTEDERVVFEIKTLVGNSMIEFFDDPNTSEEDKRALVMKEHGNQLAGQFLSNPKVEAIYVVKYIYQNDDIDEDVDSPLAEWRGHLYVFTRDDFNLEAVKTRILAVDAWIGSNRNPKDIKKDNWEVKDGEIVDVVDEKK